MSHTMSAESVARARAWVAASGRPIDRVRLDQVLGRATPDQVAEALLPYTNPDGGVGHALESDARAPESSTLGALTALDIARMHGVPFDHPVVASVCDWLVRTSMPDAAGRIVWAFLPPEAQASPHAPWWDQSRPGQLAESFNGYVANPGLALTAHLHRRHAAVPNSVPLGLLRQLGEQAVAVAREGFSADEVNAHDAAGHLVGEPAVPEAVRSAVAQYLRQVLPERVMREPADFASYGIHPLWLVPEPDHPLAEVVAQPLTVALDHTVATQQADGSWAPFWDWMGHDPQTWAVAKQEWRGALIVRNIAALKAHGRLGADTAGPQPGAAESGP